jgi:signal transduction histidine kinase
MLERIERLVGELKSVSDNVAHDLKSPLTRIRGIAETTLCGSQDIKNYREMAGAVIEESDRLVELINTMLEIARTDSGIAVLNTNRLDLRAIVHDAVDLFGPLAEDRGGAIQWELPENPVLVSGDIKCLQRAVANVLDNAIKYGGEGGIVKLLLISGNKQAKLLISDRGSGINEADIPRVFDRFYRAEKSRTTLGSGLGLSLALAIVRAHGGNITVRSSPGKGSEFTISLPLLT